MSGVAWWSQTAASNATQDPSVGWAEGMAPSSVNDSARAMMASTKKWADDIAGATVTGGTPTAFTLSTYQSFDTLARLNGNLVAFSPHTTNGATVTLNCDGLGAKPLRSAPSVELPAGVLVQGTPYVAIYNSSDEVFYLQSFYGNPYNVPIGGVLPYTGSSAPNSNFVLPYGQAISRTTYSAYFSLVSTTYGSGDGSTTFNVPDLRGRVTAGKDDMGGSAASRLSASFITGPTTLGGTGGSESRQLATSNLPPYTPSGTISNGSVTVLWSVDQYQPPGGGARNAVNNISTGTPNSAVFPVTSGSFNGTAQGGTSAAFGILQPTIVLNYLLRII